jgi:hypothetical protein
MEQQLHERQQDERRLHERRATSTTWAPWWIYLGTIIGANYLRKAFVGEGSGPVMPVVVALAFSAALFVVVTVAYRSLRR